MRKMLCFHFKNALLSFMSRPSSQLHPFLESLATPQATHPLSTARLSFINASLRPEGAACGLEKSHLYAGLRGMDAKFALSSVQLSSPRRLHIGGEMINCCGSCSLCASRAVWIPSPFTQWAFSAALLARYSARGSVRMMDSGRFCQSEWVLNDTQRHNRHTEGSS